MVILRDYMLVRGGEGFILRLIYWVLNGKLVNLFLDDVGFIKL